MKKHTYGKRYKKAVPIQRLVQANLDFLKLMSATKPKEKNDEKRDT